MHTIIEICPYCKNEYYKKTPTQSTCSNKECRHLGSKATKVRKLVITNHNLFEKSKDSAKKLIQDSKINNKKEFAKTDIIKKALLKEQVAQLGFNYCNECEKKFPSGLLDLHHIIFRSEIHGNYPQKHSKINSLLLGNEFACDCHLGKFHKHKDSRNRWIIERELWNIFPTIIKKEQFII